MNDQLSLINNNQLLIQRLQVLDVSGRILVDQASNSSNELLDLNVSALKPGYYFLNVWPSGHPVSIPFVKL